MWSTSDLLRDGSTDLTATETSAALDLGAGGTGPQGVYVQVVLPTAATGTAPTLNIKYEVSNDSGFASGVDTIDPADPTAPARLCTRIITHKRYLREVRTVGGTTPNFGKVRSGLVTGCTLEGNYDPF